MALLRLRCRARAVAVLVAGTAFGLLLALVETGWSPLRTVDRSVAHQLNEWISGMPAVVAALQVVTWLGDPAVIASLLGLATVRLLTRRRVRLACYVVVTGIGAAILAETVKELVERTRPLLAEPVGVVDGASFPSGHALGSMVGYGVLLLVFLPAVPRRARPHLAVGCGVLVLVVGFTRVALGVHFVSDVLAGWLLGLAWLGLTTAAFGHRRRQPATRAG